MSIRVLQFNQYTHNYVNINYCNNLLLCAAREKKQAMIYLFVLYTY